MRREHFRARAARIVVALTALALGACTEKAVRPDSGVIDITPKANGHYVVDGEVLTFTDLEHRIAERPPAGILLETSRIRHGAACVMLLGFKSEIPIWTRTLNGQTHELKADVKSSEVETIEKCR
ncbi:MAG TPA: hypothetical protein VI258_04405 [Rhodanobacteraceae bacterium]